MHRVIRRARIVLLALVVMVPLIVGAAPAPTAGVSSAPDDAAPQAPTAGGFLTYLEVDSPACLTGSGLNVSDGPYFVTSDCAFTVFTFTGVPDGAEVAGELVGPDGATEAVEVTGPDSAGEGRASYTFTDSSPVGELDLRILVDGQEAGRTRVFHNMLEATLTTPEGAAPGDPLEVSGTIEQVEASSTDAVPPSRTGVAASFDLQVRGPEGDVQPGATSVTAESDGTFTATLPGSATSSLEPTEGRFTLTGAVEAVDATYDDAGTTWAAGTAGTAPVELGVTPTTLQLGTSFASSTGWVKPGDTFPFRVTLTNATGSAISNAEVTMAAPASVTFTDADALGAGSVDRTSTEITWTVPTVASGDPDAPTVETLVVEAQAADLGTDPEVVWKDLSVTADLAVDGSDTATSRTHGPKVIPPAGGFDTARYGDKPFPIVPVDYTDRSHEAAHTGDDLSEVINSPDVPGSTFNLYQEMSYGQLFPIGSVPSSGIATADFEYEPGFSFTQPERVGGTCRGTSQSELGESTFGSPLYPARIADGWYQLPGDTEYYGGDFPAFTLGTGSTIDAACGPTGKSVFDAAQIADPEIDYDEFDADKDGVVDFFMMVFNGEGGNGVSQTSAPPYDNIWPHSSSLELDFKDPDTGLRGYVSDDQLTSQLGVPQCWTSDARNQFDDCAADGGSGLDELPTHVRVGPYNVNPESAIDAASVISHEYGHHLGLPDFYSGGATSSPYYDSMNLMAADYSQHMTIFGKQDLGWVVPEVVQPGDEIDVQGWSEIKEDTGTISWQTPNGEPYTLSDANGDQNVHNGQAYTAKLPQQRVIDPTKVEEQASAPYVFWSGRGNDFGCSPNGGHNMDVLLPELADVPEDADVQLSFKSSFDIEWDWDYGFVLTSTDGETFTSVPSNEGYTTGSEYNPNSAGCLDENDNGLTGTSSAHEQGEPFVTAARNPAAPDYSGDSPFLDDSYDISSLAGQEGARVRFSYFTDAAFDRPGWFVDDIVVTVDGEEIARIDGESSDQGRILQGGCGDIAAPNDDADASVCTEGWNVVDATAVNPVDHGYYLELRDRALFDFDGNGQADRGTPDWQPGVFIEYTDEAHGYGNNGVPPPPSQHYLDSVPDPGNGCDATSCEDSAFQASDGRSHFDDDSSDGGWVDNHTDDNSEDGLWHFAYDCLTLDVTDMDGTTAQAGAPDLTADATISAGDGCREFAFADADNGAPTAKFTYRPETVEANRPVVFDGSRSTDDRQAPGQLSYAWDLDGDGAFDDDTGQVVTRTYGSTGQRTVSLRVTDAEGATAQTSRQFTVVPEGSGGGPGSSPGVSRRYGKDRIDTSIRLSRRSFDSADTAVIARSDAFPDALAASTLAAEVGGPILLTPPSGLDQRVADELDRLGVEDVILVGGQQALSRQVADDARDEGLAVDRVAGPDRFATAAEIAQEVVELGGRADGAIIALGARADGRDAFPDALAASQAATRGRRPILLVTPDDLPRVTRDVIGDVLVEDGTIAIAGGQVAVSKRVANELRETGHGVGRVAGEDRYETATKLAEWAISLGGSSQRVYVVSGTNFPDALSAGPAAYAADALIVLTDPSSLSRNTRRWLRANADDIDRAIMVGGPAAISRDVDAQVSAAIN